MNAWRKHIICLLLVTFPVSLWASVVTPGHSPGDCSNSTGQVQVESDPHADYQADPHAIHGMGTGGPGDEPMDGSTHHGKDPTGTEPCCDISCVSACLVTGLSAMNLQLAAFEPMIHGMHYKLNRATQFLPGPSYPSLFRPPISQS